MIPFIRSLSELTAITESRDYQAGVNKNNEINFSMIDSGQRKRYLRSLNKKEVSLPDLPKKKRRKWMHNSDSISKFFDELDYNNQIQSSYDLTLLARQNKNTRQGAA